MEKNALACHWYIPAQPLKPQFRKKCAEIIAYGGSVHILKVPTGAISFPKGTLYCAPPSPSCHVHETGISLRINGQICGIPGGILVPGDQRYNHIDPSAVQNLHVLVATHHGGEHCASTIPSPMTSGISQVVYSYGLGSDGRCNTHKHPSHKKDYIQWKNAFKTAERKDNFTITI